MNMHSELISLAESINDHCWSRGTSESDLKFVTWVRVSLISLSRLSLQNEAVTQTELDKLRNDNKRLREESWSDGDEIRYLRQLVRGELSLTDADIDGMLANNRKQAAS